MKHQGPASYSCNIFPSHDIGNNLFKETRKACKFSPDSFPECNLALCLKISSVKQTVFVGTECPLIVDGDDSLGSRAEPCHKNDVALPYKYLKLMVTLFSFCQLMPLTQRRTLKEMQLSEHLPFSWKLAYNTAFTYFNIISVLPDLLGWIRIDNIWSLAGRFDACKNWVTEVWHCMAIQG